MIISPYYYGQYRWDNYLRDIERNQGESIHLQEPTVRLHEVATRVTDELRQHTYELRTINETLGLGFEGMRAEFNSGFTLMVDRLDQQVDLLSRIAEQLDAIHQTLKTPLRTQARELFAIGQELYQKGLWDKALEAYLLAEQKHAVDFPLQFQIGKLFLYAGNAQATSLVDLPKAEQHLTEAARYAEAYKDSIDDWSRHCGEAHFHAAHAAYLIGEQEQKAGSPDGRRQSLERAMPHLDKAIALWPKFTDSTYFQAKCHNLLGDGKEALEALTLLADRDRRYYIKVAMDQDFDSIRGEADEVFRRAITTPGPLAISAGEILSKASEALVWTQKIKPQDSNDLNKVTLTGEKLVSNKAALQTLDVDVEKVHASASRAFRVLNKISEQELKGRVLVIEKQIESVEQKKSMCQSAINGLEHKIANQEASIGFVVLFCWLLFIVSSVVLGFGMALYSSFVRQGAEDFLNETIHEMSDALNPFGPMIGSVFVVVMLYIILLAGKGLSKIWANKPLKLEVKEKLGSIEEFNQLIIPLRGQEAKANSELEPFVEWYRRNDI
jgi:tetratricopeptide (TPR) repeat protein